MAKKTTKFYAVKPSNPDEKKLLASFEIDGNKVTADIKDEELQDRADNGFFIEGKKLTLESDGPKFVKLLEDNYARSSFIFVETD